MPHFPAAPIAPSEFFESFLPAAFSEAAVPEDVKGVELELGVKLEGQGGGEWLFRLAAGRLSVAAASREVAAFTVVQSVDDWRGALWEGRGGAIGQQAAAVFRPHEGLAAARSGAIAAPTPAALAAMRDLSGLVRLVVTGGEGGDWQVGFKLGPGEIPAEATTTLTLSSEDAAAMQRGELNPLEAFLKGRVRVAGDVTLVMQMQAVQLQTSGR
jgi:hypothetical protein